MPNQNLARLFALTPLMFAMSTAMADDLGEISVNATRVDIAVDDIPASVSVVDGNDVQFARQQLGLDESLVAVPGLFMQDRYNFSQDLRVSIRGFGARSSFGIRGVKILVDGIPETLPDGQGNIDSIDIGSISQMAAIRGPSSSLYGNASGGAIIIDTEKAPETPFIAVRPSWGADGFQKHQIKAGGKADKVDYLVNVSSLDYDGYREQSATELRNFSGKFGYHIDDASTLTTVLNYTDSPVADDPGGVTLADMKADPRAAREANVNFDAGESTEQTRLGFIFKRSIGNDELQVRNYYVWKEFANLLPLAGGGAVGYDRFFWGGGVQYTRNAPLAGLENRLTVGIDYDNQDDDRTRNDNNLGALGEQTLKQNENVTSSGLFAQNETHLGDKTILTLGARYDHIRFDVTDHFLTDGDDSGDRTLTHVSPSVGLLYKLGNGTNLFANASSSFETPTTTEFANPNGGGFNPDLDPQTAKSMEVGAKGKLGQRSHYEVALFDIKVEDELISYELDAQPGRTFYENAGSSKRRGIELAFNSEPVDGLLTSLAWTRNNFEFDDFVSGGDDLSGKTTPGIPQQTLQASVGYTHPNSAFVKLNWLYVDKMYADNANETEVDSYSVGDLQMGYSWLKNHWEVSPFIGVNNLTDELYAGNIRINAFGGRYYEAAPDRNAYGGVTVRYDFR